MSTYIKYGSRYHNRERGENTMKQGIHPNYVDCTITCPFYTGKQKLVDTGGRVERFKRRFAKSGK